MHASQTEVAFRLDYQDLANLCQTDKSWREVCNRDDIWQNLYQKDFGTSYGSETETDQTPKILFDWKTEYMLRISNRVAVLRKSSNIEDRWLPHLVGITQIQAESHTALFLDIWGKVYILGTNIAPRLRLGMPTFAKNPVLFQGLPPIRKIALASSHYVFLDYRGQVWVVGRKNRGALGLGQVSSTIIPTVIPELFDIVDVVTNDQATIYLNREGRAYYSGDLPHGSSDKPELLILQDIQGVQGVQGQPRVLKIFQGLHPLLLVSHTQPDLAILRTISQRERPIFNKIVSVGDQIQVKDRYILINHELYDIYTSDLISDQGYSELFKIFLRNNIVSDDLLFLRKVLEPSNLIDFTADIARAYILTRKDLNVTYNFIQNWSDKLTQVGPDRFRDARGYYFRLI